MARRAQKPAQRVRPRRVEGGLDSTAASAVVLIALGALIAYHQSFTVPFLFDDSAAIVDNETIRTLWPPTVPLSPPLRGGLTVEGRPILNLSLAFNYAIGGVAPWGYHAVNLAIHIAAGLLLFGIVRRTLRLPRHRDRFGPQSEALALAAALLWTLHPLHTSAVTYVIQRAESLCAVFYLLTLYAFIRAAELAGSPAWLAVSAISCLFGMATKEVMMTAPLLVLLYDRTFVGGTFRQAWSQRRGYYVLLASTWLLLAWLAVGAGWRGGTVGFGTGVQWWSYLLTQCSAVVRYLQLVVWPAPLVFDYGSRMVAAPSEVLPQAIVLLVLLVATAYLLRYHPLIGFLAASFFLILAPTSSVVPVTTHSMAEHRMYLPSAALVLLGVVVLRPRLGGAAAYAAAIGVIVLGALTLQRNEVYRSAVSLWSDTVAKVPDNARARNALALALSSEGRPSEALAQMVEATRLEPGSAHYSNNLALTLADVGRLPEALTLIDVVIESAPGLAAAHDTKAYVLTKMGRQGDSIFLYEEALRLDPRQAESHNALAAVLADLGRRSEAASHYEAAIQIRPHYAEARENLRALRTRMMEEGKR